MSTELLSDADKLGVLNSHKKNLLYTQYNLDISVLLENASVSPEPTLLSQYQTSLEEVNNKISVLNTMIDELIAKEA